MRFAHRTTLSSIVLILGCLTAIVLLFNQDKPILQKTLVGNEETPLPRDSYRVVKTIDGDTFDVIVGKETKRVRLIGVDTPETKDPRKGVQCFGLEAAAYTKQMLENAIVRLVADPTQDSTDMYGRWLRYVYLSDGTNFNEQLIAQGYAYEYTYRIPYQHQAAFKTAERVARTQRQGLWAPDACKLVE